MGHGLPAVIAPMLAVAGPVPSGEGWAVEFKWDGVRAVVSVAPGEWVRALSRNTRDISASYPELGRLAGQLPEPAVLDGELVVLDERGRPSFRYHQRRMHVRAPGARLLAAAPVQFYAFDLLVLGGTSLLGEPYERRRAALDELLDFADGPMRIPPSYDDMPGEELLAVARETGLEGVVSKRLGSRYEPGKRSHAWVKTPLRASQEVIVAGWTAGEGRRATTIGALLLGVHDVADGRLRYVGHVGTGFTERALAELHAILARRARPDSPFDEPVPREYTRHARWVAPDLVGEVEHREWTGDNRLRHPSWRGLRPDREPRDITAHFFE